ncbi:unnamed protein product [Symbiodinium natans]|uniref:Uncharacterized protein n=1 Tax=Symbiodinium natans TaxID=878477 RepID=A0A812QNQ1_9DINO|nr:unnamed protein product [Symbiodinium natans]
MASVVEDRAFVSAAGYSARGQKWMDQLSQVESRLVANWEEFTAHRSEVLSRLQDLQDTLRRGVRQDPHVDTELERCSRRLQQLSQSHEETVVRVGDLKSAVESSQQSVEGLRSRLASKLQELGAAFEETQREMARLSEDLLRESTASAKRQNKAVADELLRKMSELNTKLGENMATVEEQATARCEVLRTEVQEITARLEGAGPRAAESELRRAEAHFDAQWRALRNELQGQMDELTRSTRSELGRFRGLQTQAEEGARRLDAALAESAAGRQRADRVEGQLEELRTAVARLKEEARMASSTQQSDMEEQLHRLREELSASAAKELRSQSEAMTDLQRRFRMDVDSVQELVERQLGETSTELQALKSSDAECQLQLEHLTKAAADLSESRRGFATQMDDFRSMDRQIEDALRRMEIRVERISAAAAQCLEGLDSAERSATAADRRAGELKERWEMQSESLEALRSTDVERQAQLERLVSALTELGEGQKGIRADVESFRSVDRRHVEEALSRLDLRLERLAAAAAQSAEGQAEVKAFAREAAEKVALDARDLVEQRAGELRDLLDRQAFETAGKVEALNVLDAERVQQLDQLSKACTDLAEARRGLLAEVEQGRANDRRQAEEACRRLELRLEALANSLGQCTSGLADARAQSRELVDIRHAELKDQLASLRDSLGGAAQEALNLARRHESLEELCDRRFGEERRELEALKSSDAERQKQLDRLGKALGEQSEARKGVQGDLERCQAADRQHGDSLRRLEARLEAVSASAAQCAEGVAEAKAFAREAADKAQAQAKELTEQRASELKEESGRRAAEVAGKLQAMQAAEAERDQRLQDLARAGADAAAARKGLLAEVEKCQSTERQLQDELRRVDARLEKVSAVAAQSSEGLAEVKAFARDASDRTATTSKEQLEQRSEELKELFDRRAAETATKLEALRAADAERSQTLDRLSKACAEQSEARKGIVADVEHCQSSDRQLEDALKRVDAKVESAASVAAQCTEGVAEVRVFAREAVDKASTQSKELLEIRSSELKAQMIRLHEELSIQTSKELQSQAQAFAELQRRAEARAEALQELIERRCGDNTSKIEGLRLADAERQQQLENVSKACTDMSQAQKGILLELEKSQATERQLDEAVRRLDARIEATAATAGACSEGLAEVKLAAREALEKATAQTHGQLDTQAKEFKGLLERQITETSSKIEALRATDAEHSAQLVELARSAAELAEARKGLQIDLESRKAADRQLEEALQRAELRAERLAAQASQATEGLAELKVAAREAADKVAAQQDELKERVERRASDTAARLEALRVADAERSAQLVELTRGATELTEARKGLQAQLEQCQSSTRLLQDSCQRLDVRVEKVATQTSQGHEGLAEVKSFMREVADKATTQGREQLEQRASELKELVEQRSSEHSSKMEALRASAAENAARSEQLGRDLVDLRRGLTAEIAKCEAADRQLEDALKRSSQELVRCGEGLVEVRGFAREAAEKASAQVKELVELRAGELKELCEKRAGDGDVKLEALRAQQREHREQLAEVARSCDDLAEARRGLQADVEEARAFDRRQDDALQRLAARVDRLGASAGEAAQGLVEVRSFARESAEGVAVQSKARQDAAAEETKVALEELRTQLQAIREGLTAMELEIEVEEEGKVD